MHTGRRCPSFQIQRRDGLSITDIELRARERWRRPGRTLQYGGFRDHFHSLRRNADQSQLAFFIGRISLPPTYTKLAFGKLRSCQATLPVFTSTAVIGAGPKSPLDPITRSPNRIIVP